MSNYDEYVFRLRCQDVIEMYKVIEEMEEVLGNDYFSKCKDNYQYIVENMFILCLKNNSTLLDELSQQVQLFYHNVKNALLRLPATFKSTDVNLLVAKIKNFDPSTLVKVEEYDNKTCPTCGIEFVYVDSLHSCRKCGFVNKISYEQPVTMDQQEDMKIKKPSNMKHFSTIMSNIYGESPDNSKHTISDDILEELKKEFKVRGYDVRECVNYSHSMKTFMNNIGYVKINGERVSIKEYTSNCNNVIIRMYPDLKIPRLSEINELTLRDVFLKIASMRYETNTGSCYLPKYTFTISRIIYMLMYSDPDCMNLLRFIDIGGVNTFEDYDNYLKKINSRVKLFPKFISTSENIYSDMGLYEPYYNFM